MMIEVGKRYKVTSPEGFYFIEGWVEILGLVTFDFALEYFQEQVEDYQEFYEGVEQEYLEDIKRDVEEPWVVYRYTPKQDKEDLENFELKNVVESKHKFVFPLRFFQEAVEKTQAKSKID